VIGAGWIGGESKKRQRNRRNAEETKEVEEDISHVKVYGNDLKRIETSSRNAFALLAVY
jgi:hypothetical protein